MYLTGLAIFLLLINPTEVHIPTALVVIDFLYELFSFILGKPKDVVIVQKK